MKVIQLGFAFLSLVFLGSCFTQKKGITARELTVQGHRGDRGNFPENSIPAFISALKKGVDVIELDVVISKDNKVVVSHEPYMSSQYVLTPKADSIPKKTAKSFNLYTMPYDSIRKYDIGLKGNSLFPQQQKIKTYKPLLSEVIDSVEQYINQHKLKSVHYNIELKSKKEEYGKYQPQPEVFVATVMEVLQAKKLLERINIQSFDPVILNVLHKKYPYVKIAFLTDKPGIDKKLKQLDFIPQIYSPHFKLVNIAFCDSIRKKNMKLIPWTVNEEKDINNMIVHGVDGIISDYPERILVKIR